MKKQEQKIFSPDWLECHPYKQSGNTDLYYIKLANQVLYAIDETSVNFDDENDFFLSQEEKKTLSCLLTAYFEDIISETNIWNTFVRLSKEKYGTYLPFYQTEEYYEEEINLIDIKFLCWHYLTQLNKGYISISPNEAFIDEIADKVFPIFDNAFEEAPENTKLKALFELNEEDENLYTIQSKFYQLCIETYLFHFDSLDLTEELNDVTQVAKENNLEDKVIEMANMVMTDFSFNNVTEFFNLTSPQWLAKILGEENSLYEPLMELSKKKSGYFVFVEQDSMYAQFRHVATGEILHVTNRSLVGFPKDMKSEEVILFAGFVQWQSEWWFIGDLRSYENTEELVKEIEALEDERNLFNERPDLPFNEEQQDKISQNYLKYQKEENPDDNQEELEWTLFFCDGINTDYLKNAIIENKYPGIKFPGENGKELLLKNIDFVLSYFRREL
ncbi:MAG: DUF3843 family protein [Bacteroidales bacterium]|nr:DUF3843 family protein [Bacteroidales bacterium]